MEALDKELKRIIISEEHYTQANYPFKIKANFSTLGSISEISPQGPIISFMFNDSMRDLLGFNARILYEENKLSPDPVNIISFNNFFLDCDIAQGMILKGKRTGIIHNFTMDVSPGYKYIEKFRGGVQWYMVESKYIISSIRLKLINENNQLVSFNGQSITF